MSQLLSAEALWLNWTLYVFEITCAYTKISKSLTHVYLYWRSRKLVVICRVVKSIRPILDRFLFADHDTNLYQKPLPYCVYYSPIKQRMRFFLFLIIFLFETDRELWPKIKFNRNWVLLNQPSFSLRDQRTRKVKNTFSGLDQAVCAFLNLK